MVDLKRCRDLFTDTHREATLQDLQVLLPAFGFRDVPADRLRAAMAAADYENRGRLPLPQFVLLLARLAEPDREPYDDLSAAFTALAEGRERCTVRRLREWLTDPEVIKDNRLSDTEVDHLLQGASSQTELDLAGFMRVFLPLPPAPAAATS